jgi:hypothetical protein
MAPSCMIAVGTVTTHHLHSPLLYNRKRTLTPHRLTKNNSRLTQPLPWSLALYFVYFGIRILCFKKKKKEKKKD